MTVKKRMDHISALAERIGRPVSLMEVCGTHTMSAFRTGLRSMLPSSVSLLSGPGCPVCVSPDSYLDQALAIAGTDNTTIATFGDMIRVPGTVGSLEHSRAKGADIRVVYSPLDALDLADREPGRRVVFLGVGFETTTPAVAWTIATAMKRGLDNYSVLCGHKTIPEAMTALLEGGEARIDGFMCPGHVSVITGASVYEPICSEYAVPCVVAGFEAADMAGAIEKLLQQILDKEARVEIEYSRSVEADGNERAQKAIDRVFEKCDSDWRGIGVIPKSGCRIRREYGRYDAAIEFSECKSVTASEGVVAEKSKCLCGSVLRGVVDPPQCPLFGKSCTPETPVGACMVSSEGSCAAHWKYGERKFSPFVSSK